MKPRINHSLLPALALLCMLGFSACSDFSSPKEPTDTAATSTDTQSKDSADKTEVETDFPGGCAVSERLTKAEAMEMRTAWAIAWENAWGQAPKEIDLYRSMEVAPLKKLMAQYPDAGGVRLYFGLHGSIKTFPTAPDLLLINVDTNNCTDVYRDSTLIYNPDSVNGHYWESMDRCHTFTTLWANKLTLGIMPITKERYAEVFAYTYRKSQLQAIVNDPKVKEVRAYFALRPVAGSKGIEQRVDVVFEGHPVDLDHEKPYVDFALPCPHLCDAASPMMPTLNE